MILKRKNLILSLFAVLISALIIFTVVKAATGGLLTPPSSAFSNNAPVATMHTLDDVYNSVNLVAPAVVWQAYDGTCASDSTPCNQDSDCPNVDTCNVLSLCQNASASGCTTGSGGLIHAAGSSSALLGAAEYCSYLNADGATINPTTPQNIWRLPTIDELIQGLTHDTLMAAGGGNFYGNYSGYWTSSVNSSNGNILYAYSTGGVFVESNPANSHYLVRCVK